MTYKRRIKKITLDKEKIQYRIIYDYNDGSKDNWSSISNSADFLEALYEKLRLDVAIINEVPNPHYTVVKNPFLLHC